MKSVCIPHTSLPRATPLFTSLLYSFEQVKQFYPHQPSLDLVQPTLAEQETLTV